VNPEGTLRLAQTAKQGGVERFAKLDEIFLDRFVRLRGSASWFPSASSMRCSAARSAGSSPPPVPTPHMRTDNASATPMLLTVTPSGGTHGS